MQPDKRQMRSEQNEMRIMQRSTHPTAPCFNKQNTLKECDTRAGKMTRGEG